MLKHLFIQNYALIRELDMDFPPSLVIITGETGAGKSIMLGALSLLLGKKTDSSVFCDNGANCVVEGEFECGGREIILRRVITPAGRSRAFLNDEPVTLAELSAISDDLIDIHEQNQSRMLSDENFQMEILDSFSGSADCLSEYREVWAECHSREKELEELRAKESEAAKDRDYREFQFSQLSDARLREGELEELEAEQQMLANAEMIGKELASASEILGNENFSMVQGMKEAVSSLKRVSKFFPDAGSLSERLDSCKIELEDIEEEIGRLSGSVEVSPGRLEQVEERMGELYALLKKHGASSVQELIGIRDALDESLRQEEVFSEREAELVKTCSDLHERISDLSLELSRVRSAGAERLSVSLEESIRILEMPYASFRVELVRKDAPGPSGADGVRFLFSANGGRPVSELSKVASGGELSRVMLALKKVMSEYTSLPTMIFDEIDTGVSGKVADRMGRMISDMGHRMQIFAITHLPQIASQKGAHYLIYKTREGDGSVTGVRLLEGEERVREIARMLSGDTLTDAALENARCLLNGNII